MSIIPRHVEPWLLNLMSAFRAVVVNGPRQSGKTTLLESFVAKQGGLLRSLDNKDLREASRNDAETFVRSPQRPLVIDEVQRGGDALILAVKYALDHNRSPGQFILAGSTRFLTVPTLSESLAGRIAFVDLYPLSMSEQSRSPVVTHSLFSDPTVFLDTSSSEWTRDAYIDLFCQGGFPEAISMTSADLRREWFSGYVRTVTRDIEEFADIHQATLLPKIATLIAGRAGGALVLSDLAQTLGVSLPTIRSYISYLQTVFFYTEVQPWSNNIASKVVKTPKAFPVDSGLTASLMKVGADPLREPGNSLLGPLTETFVYNELLRLSSVDKFDIYYYRDRNDREIDFILEDPNGRIIAIEVKASASPSSHDARHLRWLKEKLGNQLVAGIVLHLGVHSVSLGGGILALPISTLWSHHM